MKINPRASWRRWRRRPGCGWTNISVSSSPRATGRANRRSPSPSPGNIPRWRTASLPRRRVIEVLVERRKAVDLPRPHRGARRHRARGDQALWRREGPPRAPRLRRPHRQGRRDAGAGQSELGALQARSRARPYPHRRGAGHQREAVADRAPSGGGIRGRRRCARPASPAPCSRSATRSSRSFRSRGRRHANTRRCESISRRCSAAPRPPGGM